MRELIDLSFENSILSPYDVTIIDADDYLKEGCLDTLKSVAAEKEYDIIEFNIETDFSIKSWIEDW